MLDVQYPFSSPQLALVDIIGTLKQHEFVKKRKRDLVWLARLDNFYGMRQGVPEIRSFISLQNGQLLVWQRAEQHCICVFDMFIKISLSISNLHLPGSVSFRVPCYFTKLYEKGHCWELKLCLTTSSRNISIPTI